MKWGRSQIEDSRKKQTNIENITRRKSKALEDHN